MKQYAKDGQSDKTRKEKSARYQKEYRRKNKQTIKAKRKDKYLLNKESIKTQMGEFYQKNKDKIINYKREWRQKNKEHIAASERRWRYKMSDNQYNDLLLAQNNCCAVCRKPFTKTIGKGAKRPFVDHDHSTGKVRGLLCHHCNAGLGYFFDNTELLHYAINYLIKHNEQK